MDRYAFTVRWRIGGFTRELPDYGWRTHEYCDSLEEACNAVQVARHFHGSDIEVCIVDNETNEIIFGEVL